MKRFLIKLLFFLLPIVVISYILDTLVSNRLSESKTIAMGEYSVWNDIFSGNINSDILIQGSSRAWVHFNPKIITDSTGISCYNIGVDGHHFSMQNIRENILLKYNKKPKLIIYSLETGTLSKREDLYNINQFLPYVLKYKNDLKKPLLSFDGFDQFDFEVPLIRYYGNFVVVGQLLSSLRHNNPMEGRERGFKGQKSSWNGDLDRAKAKFASMEVKIDNETTKLFRQYLSNCKKNGIRVVLVYSPEYIEGQEFISNRSRIIKLYQQLSREYEIPFIDFSNDEICLEKQYFYNATHMNSKGADLFTEKLIKVMKEQRLFP